MNALLPGMWLRFNPAFIEEELILLTGCLSSWDVVHELFDKPVHLIFLGFMRHQILQLNTFENQLPLILNELILKPRLLEISGIVKIEVWMKLLFTAFFYLNA